MTQDAARDAIVVATGPDEPAEDYVTALRACGVPAERVRVVASQSDSAESAAALVAGAAGLVLCGGADIAPELYREAELAGAEMFRDAGKLAGVGIDRQRDAFELRLLTAAQTARVPVFGVCRGFQMLNVFLGGTLYQHLPAQLPGALRHAADAQQALSHAVFVEAGDHPLTALLRREPCVVNSSHHQGVRALAHGLAAVAVSSDDLVEAAALAPGEPWWACGVQWHPENLVELPLQRALWQHFLDATHGKGFTA